jgi:ABC-type oligopeptide transport system ATPase subunit
VLELANIHKRFDLNAGFFARAGRYVYAVNGVSLRIGAGETYGLVGESGCGKTTTARLAVRMYPANEGEITFHSRDGRAFRVGELDRAGLNLLRSRVGYVFQDPARALNPRMTVQDILLSGYRYSPRWPGKRRARDDAARVINDVGLQSSDLVRRPADFSGGQRQRIAIARALITQPELLICDEVVSSLDVSIQGQILNLLMRLRRQFSLSLLFIAHDLAVVSYFCDRVGVMYRGLLVEEAPAQKLIGEAQHPYTRHLYASLPRLGIRVAEHRDATRRFGEIPDPTIPPVSPEQREAVPGEERPGLRKVDDLHYVSRFFVNET